MPQIGGKNAKKTSSDSKRHFTVVMGNKEHGLYVSSTPSSAAKKAVTKLCTSNKGKKVEFHIREITQGSKKKTYGPYEGYIEKLKEPIELKGRVIKYKPVAKLSKKQGVKKGGNGSDSINQPAFNNLNKLNSAIPFSGEYIFPPANELTIRQKRRQEGQRKAHGLLTNAEKEKKAAANALYLAKIEAASAQREKEQQKKQQNEKERLLEELARNLMHDGKIERFKYFSHDLMNIQFPPFYLLVDSPFELQYFLTFINNEYIAFHIRNIGTIENKGDIFAGPTDDFEEFTRDVNNYFSKPNSNMSSKKIYLQKVNEKIYPTYRIENISGYHKNP